MTLIVLCFFMTLYYVNINVYGSGNTIVSIDTPPDHDMSPESVFRKDFDNRAGSEDFAKRTGDKVESRGSDEAILGKEDRRKCLSKNEELALESRYSFICYLNVHGHAQGNPKSKVRYGTGVLIAPNLILTAAHNIVNGKGMKRGEVLEVLRGTSRGDDQGDCWGECSLLLEGDKDVDVHIHTLYEKNKDGPSKHDMVLIEIKNKSECGNLVSERKGPLVCAIPVQYIDFGSDGIKVKTIFGETREFKSEKVKITGHGRGGVKYTMDGPILGSKSDAGLLYYKIDTEKGQSGSPIYFELTDGGETFYYCCGVHTFGSFIVGASDKEQGKQGKDESAENGVPSPSLLKLPKEGEYNVGCLIDQEIIDIIKKVREENNNKRREEVPSPPYWGLCPSGCEIL